METAKIEKWLPKRSVAARYDTSTRTIERWVKSGKFPPPTRMPNGRDYWSDIVIEAHERSLVGDRQIPSTEPELGTAAG
jgi:predicted site-specific integrase-resolvase